MEIEEVPFTKLISKIVDNRGRTCPTAEAGLPLIATNCIRNDILYPAFEKVRYVSQDTYENWFRGHPEPGDLIFVCKGTPGRVCMTPDPVRFCIAQDMVAVRADPRKVYPKYLFALLRSQAVQAKIANMHVGTLIPHFKKGDFDRLLLLVPDKNTQVTMGDTYFELSAKIELNRRMNATLEAMERALFQSWFVDFDPVRAKLDGTPVPGIDKTTAALFPSHLEESPIGKVPQGWRVMQFADILTPYSVRVGEQAVPEFSATVTGLSSRDKRFKKQLSKSQSKNKLIVEGDLVFGFSREVINFGLMREPVGAVSPVYEVFKIDASKTEPELLERMFRFNMPYYMDILKPGAREGKPIDRNYLLRKHLLIPEFAVQRAFLGAIQPWVDKIKVNEAESHNLATLRDTLLPKLLSGVL